MRRSQLLNVLFRSCRLFDPLIHRSANPVSNPFNVHSRGISCLTQSHIVYTRSKVTHIPSSVSRSASTITTISKFTGESGLEYQVQKILQDKDTRASRVFLASHAGESFILKEIPEENFDIRLKIYQLAGQSPYLRGLRDTIPVHSMFVHSYVKESFLSLVQRPLPIAVTKGILKCTLQGLLALHQKDLVHLDIKANNIMVDWQVKNGSIEVGRVELIDLENCVLLPLDRAVKGMQVGNMLWRSPEAHAEGPIQMPTDMFSFGIVCIYAVLRQHIFWVEEEHLADGTDALAIVLERQLSYFADFDALEGFFQYLGPNRWHPLFEDILKDFNESNPFKPFHLWELGESRDGFDDDFKDLISRLTNFNPTKRITAQEALEHRWFAGVE